MTLPTALPTDPSSASEFDKQRQVCGSRWLTIYFRHTSNSNNKQLQRSPLGKQDAPEQFTNPFPAAGVWPSAPSKKTTVRLRRRKHLTKLLRNSFAQKSPLKSRTFYLQPPLKQDVHATSTSLTKSRTEQLPTASGNSDLRPILAARRHATLTCHLS